VSPRLLLVHGQHERAQQCDLGKGVHCIVLSPSASILHSFHNHCNNRPATIAQTTDNSFSFKQFFYNRQSLTMQSKTVLVTTNNSHFISDNNHLKNGHSF
jgi:hypothetical protein